MTFEQVIKAAIPDADPGTVEHVLWGRTSFPMGQVTARDLYGAARRYARACRSGRKLCDFCDRLARSGQWECEMCAKALGRVDIKTAGGE